MVLDLALEQVDRVTKPELGVALQLVDQSPDVLLRLGVRLEYLEPRIELARNCEISAIWAPGMAACRQVERETERELASSNLVDVHQGLAIALLVSQVPHQLEFKEVLCLLLVFTEVKAHHVRQG